MPNPPPPQTPNFNPGVGRLTTDRYDFQNHIDGNSFRHQAGQIDLFPTVVINGTSVDDVQDAIALLATIVSPPVIPQATNIQLGIIKLNGDLGGVASAVTVTGLQGRPISSNLPVTNNVLTWNGAAWTPSPATNAFVPNGDLAGNNVLQQVIGLTGDGLGHVNALCNTIQFLQSVTSPTITQLNNPSGPGQNLTISAQGSAAASNNGGYVVINGGQAGAGGLRGGVRLQVNTSGLGTDMVTLSEPVVGQRVLSLLTGALSTISSINMPAGTGDLVMYVANTSTPPTSGSPTGGAIMYASGGQMFVKQADGNNFAIGSIPNPSIWGTAGQQTYSVRNYVTSFAAAAATITIALQDNTATKVDVILVGKEVSSGNSAQYNLSMGYMRTSGGGPVGVGTITSSDPRNSAGASGWAAPNISTSSNNLVITTGASNTGSNINWFVVTQLSMSQG